MLLHSYARRAGATPRGVVALPPHCSIYHDLLMLALKVHGRHINRDMFDELYIEAHSHLPPRVLSTLAPQDQPPSATAIVCRKVLMPLDICKHITNCCYYQLCF